MHSTTVVNCSECPPRDARSFCSLTVRSRRRNEAAPCATIFPPGATLFREGEPPRGVFVLCRGRVKLSASSRDGRTIVTGLGGAGEVLGVAAAISGDAHTLSAETMDQCHATFIGRGDFLDLVRESQDIAGGAVAQLSAEIHQSAETIRSLALCESSRTKLARLLVDWSEKHGRRVDGAIRLEMHTTHELIGQMIGTSRETVTRQISEFKRRRIIEVTDSAILIRDPSGLSMQASL